MIRNATPIPYRIPRRPDWRWMAAGALLLVQAGLPASAGTLPTVSITDVERVEGDNGNATLQFTVSRSHTQGAVSVRVDTANGNATAGYDYGAVSGRILQFADGGASSQVVEVPVYPDTMVEADEMFAINLSEPVGAVLGDGAGNGTIVNDDQTQVIVQAVVQAEGDDGSTVFEFLVQLEDKVQGGFELPYATRDDSAVAGSDYLPAGGRLVFAGNAGEIRSIAVAVHGDRSAEADERFYIDLQPPTVGGIGRDASISGLIVNDDLYADLAISIDNGQTSIEPGQQLSYAIEVRNTSSVQAVPQADVRSLLPAGLANASWTCSGSGGAQCAASGSGDLLDVASLPAGAVATYVLRGSASAAPGSSLALSASVAPRSPYSDPQPANDSATDSDPVQGDQIFGNRFE